MDRRQFLKSGIGCVCLALLPPLPSVPVGELSDFARDQGDQMLVYVMYNNNIYVKALKKAGGTAEQLEMAEAMARGEIPTDYRRTFAPSAINHSLKHSINIVKKDYNEKY